QILHKYGNYPIWHASLYGNFILILETKKTCLSGAYQSVYCIPQLVHICFLDVASLFKMRSIVHVMIFGTDTGFVDQEQSLWQRTPSVECYLIVAFLPGCPADYKSYSL